MDISEIESLRENINWLSKQMPKVVQNWQSTRPNCSYNFGIIREICNKPGIIAPQIFDPLIKWLADYELNREGRIAFPGASGLENFFRIGIRRIYNFILVADFLSINSQYYIPSASLTNPAAYRETKKSQDKFAEFVDIISSKLIGCNKSMSFLFLNLTQGLSLADDLKRMQDYLSNYCASLKFRELKR